MNSRSFLLPISLLEALMGDRVIPFRSRTPRLGIDVLRHLRRALLVSMMSAVPFWIPNAASQTADIPNPGLEIAAPSDVAAPPGDAQTLPSGLAMKVLKTGN